MYTAIIIDDEQPQQEMLSNMLRKHFPRIRLLAVCGGVKEGIEKINLLKPQLVFLDVMMPPLTGFDLLKGVEKLNFEVIFVTSYEKFAIEAFRFSAIDYLLKPYGVDDLKIAIDKFEERAVQKKSFNHLQNLLDNVFTSNSEKTKIALPTLTGFVFVEIGNISHCVSDNSYCTFTFADKSSNVVCKSISECHELLRGINFVRIHNRTIINLSFLNEYVRGRGGQVRMKDGTFLDVSRNHKDALLNAIRKV